MMTTEEIAERLGGLETILEEAKKQLEIAEECENAEGVAHWTFEVVEWEQEVQEFREYFGV